MSGHRRDVVLGLLVASALILLLEAAGRAVWPDDSAARLPDLTDWVVFSPTLGWEPRPNFVGDLFGGPAQFGPDGRRLTGNARAGGGGPRIVCLGDSITHGFGVADGETFAARLAERLGGAEMVNLGVSGYSSYQGLTVLESKALTLRPDVILAAFNFNDRRYVLHPTSQDGADHFRRFYLGRLVEPLHRLGLARGLRRAAPALFGGTEPEAVDLRTLTVRVPPDAFRANLERMADLAQRHGARLVWVQFGDNPGMTYHSRRGYAEWRASRIGRAVDWFEESLESDAWPFGDMARRALSELYARLGRAEDAGRVAWAKPQPWATGGQVLLPDTDYADIMAEVGGRLGVPVFDARRLLDRDPSVYTDIAHFDARGHALVAGGLADFLRERGILGASPGAPR